MIETIHIFDEFSQAPNELTPEQRHKKRMALDPMIYDILKHKYGKKLEEFWNSHTVPNETDSYLILVERRIHPNLAFVLQNAAYFARTWGIVLVCSDVNYEYCKTICGDKDVKLLPLFQGNPEPLIGKTEYNTLLKSASFYSSLPGEHHLFLQVDTYLRKAVPEHWKEFDHLAAPYEWDESSVGGGLSYRKKSSMITLCNTQTDTVCDEDAYICEGVKALGMKMPPFEDAVTYISESCIYEDPIGVHQWWTFFFPNQTEGAEEIFHSLLSLQID